jgi:hypothetical protein
MTAREGETSFIVIEFADWFPGGKSVAILAFGHLPPMFIVVTGKTILV